MNWLKAFGLLAVALFVLYFGVIVPCGLVQEYGPLLRAPGSLRVVISSLFDAAVFSGLFWALILLVVKAVRGHR